MQRKDITRVLALLGASATLPTAGAAPPSPAVGQIEAPPPPSAERASSLSPPPRGAELARTMQIPPDRLGPSHQPSSQITTEAFGAPSEPDCFLGPQIAAVAKTLPLDETGLRDVCASFIWLEGDALPGNSDRGIRSLQGVETAPPQPEPAPPAADAGAPDTDPASAQQDPFVP